ncbi:MULTISPECIES: helix-turn-helix transcriptional regulator [unclassified Phenylobacterium]|uniref:helix-turn-helix domain-containing protein n=1 Tax=unclassified Phenylobacterium TaxID=2640670 RepID=UPI0008691E39|nr:MULTISPECIES: helix-turn-helix transcriptional regulator [unclassified Phenylobacterium]ODT87385.1 MAG: transcriptional regulator [Phenylobacterium sp. SCN 70-31]WGU41412.1 helix-turn-helix transcriptional regulator [Phenylobacterium sp. NIBR 498073]
MDVRRRVGLNVKRLREAQGISQEDLADRAGVHRTYVSGVERGVRNPTITVLEKIAGALAAPLAELVG